MKNILKQLTNQKNIIISLKILEYSFLVIGTIAFIYYYFIGHTTPMFISIMIVYLSSIINCLCDIKNKLALLLFYFSFFIFLMGRMFMDIFIYGYVTFNFNHKISIHILVCLYISILFLRIGGDLLKIKKKKVSEFIGNNIIKSRMKNISRIIFYFAFIATIPIVIEEYLFIIDNSYGELYTSFQSKLPAIIRIISNMRTISVFIFLGCFPTKKEVKLPIILILFSGILLMFTGDRTNLSQAILIIILYFGIRQAMNPEEQWIKVKHLFFGIIIIPFFLAFMSFYVYLREGFDTNEVTFLSQFVRFFRSLGRSVDVIGYEKLYENELPINLYSISNIINYLKYNHITELLFNMQMPQQHTVQFAIEGYSFMHSLTYLIDPTLYLNGHGAGSSYIAEVYFDFGYIGIMFINIIYGVFLTRIRKLKAYNPVLVGCYLQAVNIMFYIPRGPADYPVTYILNFTVITCIFVILLYSYYPIIISRRCKSE